MATETTSRDDFGEVSQLRGLLFEYLSLGASVVGILALALLLVYVTIDAFGLWNADDAWLLAYVAAFAFPAVGFLLYAADDPRVTRQSGLALVGGLVGFFALFRGLEALGMGVPRLSWPLAYIFGVLVPVTGYVGYAAYQRPAGAVGIGLLGRVAGGLGLAVAVTSVFVIADVYRWFLVFTLGIAPAAAIYAAGRVRASRPLTYLAVPVALLGAAAGFVLREFLVVYPRQWLIYALTLGVPVAVAVAALVWRRRGERSAAAVAVGLVAVVTTLGYVSGMVGLSRAAVVLLLLTVAVPVGLQIDRVLSHGRGSVGLLFPVVLVAGALAGTVLVDLLAATGPSPWLDWSYVTNPPSTTIADDAGLYPAIVGSIFIITIVALLSFALGVGTAVFLEDYTPDTGPLATVTRLIQINISNLAGVPSVVYGLLGLGLFVNLLGLGFGTVVVAAVTLSLLILPIVIISAQEAIRSVPDDMRQASYGLGATRWQTTKNVVLPESLPGILTGTILSLGRAIGETAPLIMIGAPTTVFAPPEGLLARTSAMPMQIYAWAALPQQDFRYGVVAAGVVTLLVVLIGLNATAILVRNRYERSDG
ncbi:phosphate ABC transporter permease PstA [Natronomonas salina]|uniref:phosphate ABC transporter permease PstA n=1 Tax=Natronomonas salina TaxID=1710540 RepID=UPI0015B38E9F|nr:phosphate ABC transporter permease PstA [Natronomonas salina]QLD89742.1 phosphate ABC transporter permease PstA [Natronomonas salina]